ncbi:hypothetical protein VCR12J2_1040033 [Vibrio coralliirubri]|nr:hypothetical protein VCR12J2_1040033 [Vibrio coralliirubri]
MPYGKPIALADNGSAEAKAKRMESTHIGRSSERPWVCASVGCCA